MTRSLLTECTREAKFSNSCRNLAQPLRKRVRVFVLLLLASCLMPSVLGQFVNRGVARWAVGSSVVGGRWYGPVQYGATGYSYYPNGAQTAYGNAVRAQAALTMAQGRAMQNAAVANEYNQKAQAQYLENKAKYDEMRRQQRAAYEARKANEKEEQKERAATWKPRSRDSLYTPLNADQLDRTTGKVVWPDSLAGAAFEEGRSQIEAALQSIAQNGPDERTAGIIFETVKEMKTHMGDVMSESGIEVYTETRNFLNSLSVEGYNALEKP